MAGCIKMSTLLNYTCYCEWFVFVFELKIWFIFMFIFALKLEFKLLFFIELGFTMFWLIRELDIFGRGDIK